MTPQEAVNARTLFEWGKDPSKETFAQVLAYIVTPKRSVYGYPEMGTSITSAPGGSLDFFTGLQLATEMVEAIQEHNDVQGGPVDRTAVVDTNQITIEPDLDGELKIRLIYTELNNLQERLVLT